jgi:flagellar hook-length control protein FliK
VAPVAAVVPVPAVAADLSPAPATPLQIALALPATEAEAPLPVAPADPDPAASIPAAPQPDAPDPLAPAPATPPAAVIAAADSIVEAVAPPTAELPAPVHDKTKAGSLPASRDGDDAAETDASPAAVTLTSVAAPDLPDAPVPPAAGEQAPAPLIAPAMIASMPSLIDTAIQTTETATPAGAELAPAAPAGASTLATRLGVPVADPAAAGPAPAAPRPESVAAALFGQTLSQQAPASPLLPAAYTPEAPAPAPAALVQAQAGRIGRDMGAVIARQVIEGREQVTVRLNPPEMGRIDVRLSFDHGGGLRAVMAAESPAAMDLLRRDVGELNRALTDAGVRTDAQSFRFDSRQSGSHFAQSDHPRQQSHGQPAAPARAGWAEPADATPDRPYRPLRASGGIDMIA